MSRIGRKPIVIPQGVKVQVVDGGVSAEGPKGKLVQPLPPGLSAEVEGTQVVSSRAGEDRKVRALHGLARSLVQNMGTGVKAPFEKKLEVVGIGYRGQVQGRTIQLALGYSHPVIFPLPEGITAEIDKQTLITLRGADKALRGQTASKLRMLRKPDPYKGKGIKYADEVVRRKVGKKAGAAAKCSRRSGAWRATSDIGGSGGTCAGPRRGRASRCSGASTTSTLSSSTTTRVGRSSRSTAGARRFGPSTVPAATSPRRRWSARSSRSTPRVAGSSGWCSIAAATSTTGGSRRLPTRPARAGSCFDSEMRRT